MQSYSRHKGGLTFDPVSASVDFRSDRQSGRFQNESDIQNESWVFSIFDPQIVLTGLLMLFSVPLNTCSEFVRATGHRKLMITIIFHEVRMISIPVHVHVVVGS